MASFFSSFVRRRRVSHRTRSDDSLESNCDLVSEFLIFTLLVALVEPWVADSMFASVSYKPLANRVCSSSHLEIARRARG